MAIESLIKARRERLLAAAGPAGSGDADAASWPPGTAPASRLDELARRARQRLLERGRDLDPDAPDGRERARQLLWRIIEEEEGHFGHLLLTPAEKAEILERVVQSLFGYGVIEPFLRDPRVTEVMINGPDRVFVEDDAGIRPALDRRGRPVRFGSVAELMHVVEKILAPINRHVTESDPIVDGRLPDGSRINVVLRPVALNGPVVTIRKFPHRPYSLDDLVRLGTLDEALARWLRRLVRARYNLVVSGGTGSGKTTLLNALCMEIPASERIVTVEDAAELRLVHAENIVRLETRPPNIEGKGRITIRDLVRTALRMRPDRIIVGEVRGGEALDMLQAMNTGHEGSLTTAHANSAVDLLSRLETMTLMAGTELPLAAVRRQIAGAVEVVVHLARVGDGARRVVQVTEVLGLAGEEIATRDLFTWRDGALRPTGATLARSDKLLRAGSGVSEG